MTRADWDQLFISIKILMSQRSSDPNTKVGTIIVDPDNVVVSMGYNGWPRYIDPIPDDDPRLQRPAKYFWMEHGERNAIYNATRLGRSVEGCTMYTGLPCADCARAVIQSGIAEIVSYLREDMAWEEATGHRWSESQEASKAMLIEAGVKFREWDGPLLMPVSQFADKLYHYPLKQYED